MLKTSLSGLIESENIRSFVDSFNMGLMLFLFSHLLACLWIFIGLNLFHTEGKGWIVKLTGDERQSTDLFSLYITSMYFIMTSFSSVGYGDVTGSEEEEYLY